MTFVATRIGVWLVAGAFTRPDLVEALFLLIVLVSAPAAVGLVPSLGTCRIVGFVRPAMLPAGIALGASLALPAGVLAGGLALPWAAAMAALGLVAVVDRWRRGIRADDALAAEAALGFFAIGGLLTLAHRVGFDPAGFGPFLSLLAGVHFHVAGGLLLSAAAILLARRPGRTIRLAAALASVGGPLTAIGFFGLPLVNVGGALLTVAGAFLVGALHVHGARRLPRPAASAVGVAGVSLMLSMPLAAGWAIGLVTGHSIVPLEVMTRVHGGLNAIGFGVVGLLGWRFAEAEAAPTR
jgi:hypothetical protein